MNAAAVPAMVPGRLTEGGGRMLTSTAWKNLPLLREEIDRNGFAGLTGGIPAARLRAMKAESLQACFQPAESVGGRRLIAFSSSTAELGASARAFLVSPEVTRFIGRLFGGEYQMTEDRSCITVYGAGDHLALHQDDPPEGCRATAIVYLRVIERANSRPSAGLHLHVWGRAEPLAGEVAHTRILAREGLVALGRGSEFWHERPPLAVGEEIMALTTCFHIADG